MSSQLRAIHYSSSTLLALAAMLMLGAAACGNDSGGLTCETGLSVCADSCVNTLADPNNCGGCNVTCGAGESCVQGECTIACPAEQIACDGTCIDPATNASYCGAAADCQGANSGEMCKTGAACVASACQCNPGLTECATACVNIQNDPANCGACGMACSEDQVCMAGGCVLNTTFAGALPPTLGRWEYNGVVGIQGANAECNTRYPGSFVCDGAALERASAAGELANATDTNGSTVLSFWFVQAAVDPAAPPPQCLDVTTENVPWNYQTAHLGQQGLSVPLDGATGTIAAEPVVTACNTLHSTACCMIKPADANPN